MKLELVINMESSLTIIVPCYNVAEYLHECLDSIRNQSYKYFRILLMDDGSTDETGTICDEYAKMDNRFTVIHHDHCGSSQIRNVGIENVKTEYLTFVDSDDYINPEMYQVMMDNLTAHPDADIAACGVADLIKGELVYRVTDRISNECEIVNQQESVIRILDDEKWKSYTCNKIFRKSLFNGIKFPEGRSLDEDTSVMHLIYHQARMTLYNPSEFYVYRHRAGSICLRFDAKSMAKKAVDRMAARWERLQFTETHPEYHVMLNKMRNVYAVTALSGCRIAAKYPQYFPKKYLEQHRNNILSFPLNYLPAYFSKRKRIELCVLKHIPVLFKIVYKYIRAW